MRSLGGYTAFACEQEEGLPLAQTMRTTILELGLRYASLLVHDPQLQVAQHDHLGRRVGIVDIQLPVRVRIFEANHRAAKK